MSKLTRNVVNALNATVLNNDLVIELIQRGTVEKGDFSHLTLAINHNDIYTTSVLFTDCLHNKYYGNLSILDILKHTYLSNANHIINAEISGTDKENLKELKVENKMILRILKSKDFKAITGHKLIENYKY